jgi:hypothetical protein
MASNSLVSYAAPSADSVTFYVSNLDASATTGSAGTFTGGSSTQAEVSYSSINTVYNVTAATASTWFEFYTIPQTGGDQSANNTNSSGNDIVGVNSGTAPVFTSLNSGVSNSTTQENRNNLQKDFVDTLAEHVFGSREAADLFNNQSTIKGGWDTAEAAAATAANTSAGTGTIAVDASKEICEAILVAKYARFGLAYNATTTGFSGGTSAGLTVTSGGSGTGAKVTVIMTSGSTTDINAVMLYDDDSTSAGPITGSGYAKGDSLTITDDSSNTVTIASINSVQAAMLNGFLDDSSNATTVPLEAGDKIRIKYSLGSASGQTNAQGGDVSFTQSYYVDYHLQ